jgi:hypothetical protein
MFPSGVSERRAGGTATDAYDVGGDITTPQKQLFMMLTPPPDRKY